MLCSKIVFLFLFWHSKQYLYTTCSELVFFGVINEQYLVILWVNWYKNEGFWKRFTCNPSYLLKNHLHFKVRIILVQKVFTQGTHLEKANEHRILQKCESMRCPYFWSERLTWLLYCFRSSLYFFEESIKIKFWHEFKIVKVDVFYFSTEVSRHKVVSKNGLSLWGLRFCPWQ